MNRRWALIALMVAALAPSATAQEKDAFAYNRMLGRGINLGNALDAPSEGEWGITLEAEYFEKIRQAGFDSVRIPTRWATHTASGEKYEVDATYFKRVDWAVDQALSRGLVAVLNVHHDNAMDQDPERELPRLMATWRQIADRYKSRPDRLYFELLNEPHDKLTDEKWAKIAPQLLAIVRETNPTRIVILGGGHWNSFDRLNTLELPRADRRIIGTFHYYNPFHFTHQGAEWVEGSAAWKGTKWTGSEAKRAAIQADFAKAAAWSKAEDRPVFVGEFGAYSAADMESRARWTAAVVRQAEEFGFSTAYWEFGSGFGAYDRETSQWRKPLLDALIPPKARPAGAASPL
jgi:endoglucanase